MAEQLEAARTVLQAYEAAFNSNDAAAMNALFTSDASFVNFGGRLVLGRERRLQTQAAVFAAEGPLAHVRVTHTIQAVLELADDLVLLHARQQSEGQGDGPDAFAATFTALLRAGHRGWRICFGQNTPLL